MEKDEGQLKGDKEEAMDKKKMRRIKQNRIWEKNEGISHRGEVESR